MWVTVAGPEGSYPGGDERLMGAFVRSLPKNTHPPDATQQLDDHVFLYNEAASNSARPSWRRRVH